jgi:hypothetical protein
MHPLWYGHVCTNCRPSFPWLCALVHQSTPESYEFAAFFEMQVIKSNVGGFGKQRIQLEGCLAEEFNPQMCIPLSPCWQMEFV